MQSKARGTAADFFAAVNEIIKSNGGQKAAHCAAFGKKTALHRAQFAANEMIKSKGGQIFGKSGAAEKH